MDRLSISQMTTREWTLEEDAIRFAANGFSSIGVWRDKLSDYSIDFAASIFNDLRLQVSSLQWAGGFTGTAGMTFREAIDDTIDAIRQASQINAKCLIIHPGARGFHTQSHAGRLIESALHELVPIAQGFDVRLALTPMPLETGKAFTFLTSLQSALEVCKPFRAQDVGVVLNLHHFSHQSLIEMLDRELVRRLALVQIADHRVSTGRCQRCLFGDGSVRIAWWMSQLVKLGFTGTFEAELFGPEVQSIKYSDRLVHLKKYFSENTAGILAI